MLPSLVDTGLIMKIFKQNWKTYPNQQMDASQHRDTGTSESKAIWLLRRIATAQLLSESLGSICKMLVDDPKSLLLKNDHDLREVTNEQR